MACSNELAAAIRDFFADHLPRLRGMSPHTLQSYRDSFKLFLRFLSVEMKRNVAVLNLQDLTPERLIRFLQHLEDARKNTAATRNVRLAAVHSFFRYLATRHPERLEQCQQMLRIPFKRARTRSVEYLEYDEIEAVLGAIDRRSSDGRRDYILMVMMFNTGARVQEIVDLKPCDLQLQRPFHVRLFGKGRKERICALWPKTAQIVKTFLSERQIEADNREPLFRNHCGRPLTRFGVRYILAKYCRRAQPQKPTLTSKRLHPHSMRHSTAVYLLKTGTDLVTISQWLGHASVNTTNRYTTVDLEMKRKAIEKAKSPGQTRSASWRKNPSILEWLESL